LLKTLGKGIQEKNLKKKIRGLIIPFALRFFSELVENLELN